MSASLFVTVLLSGLWLELITCGETGAGQHDTETWKLVPVTAQDTRDTKTQHCTLPQSFIM